MVSGDFCHHDWPGSGCDECAEERRRPPEPERAAATPPSGDEVKALIERLETTHVWKRNPNPEAQSWGEGQIVNEDEVRAVMMDAARFLRSLPPGGPA